MTFDAALYDLLHTGNPGDVAFYKEATEGCSSVLELGAGSGRIALALAKAGRSVTAVDHHPGMLARLRSNAGTLVPSEMARLTLLRADMRALPLRGQPFDGVIIPYNAILCLLTEQDVAACLQGVRALLKPGGTLLFDIYHVPEEPDDGEPDPMEEDAFDPIATVDSDRTTIDIFEACVPHPDPRRMDTAYRFRLTDSAGNPRVEDQVIEQRCLYAAELPSLLGNAGFAEVSITGDFDESPVTEDTGQLVVRATRPREKPSTP